MEEVGASVTTVPIHDSLFPGDKISQNLGQPMNFQEGKGARYTGVCLLLQEMYVLCGQHIKNIILVYGREPASIHSAQKYLCYNKQQASG